MSIYDDLANSDFVDAGKFKAQLAAMGHNDSMPDKKAEYELPMDEDTFKKPGSQPGRDANLESLRRQK